MKLKQTKALENALARGLLASQRAGGGNPVDRAFLFLLEEGNCHAAHILGKFIKSWESYQIKVRIEKDLESATQENIAADRKLYDNLMAALRKVCAEFGQEGGEPLVNTGHFLLYLLRSRKFASSRVLSTFNIPRNLVAEMISDLPFDEDYYMEMNALRNIRILRIDPKDTGYGGTAGDGRERSDEEDTERNDVKPHGKSVLKELENTEPI